MTRYEADIAAEEVPAGTGMRRKAARYAVPVVVVGLAAATIGLVPALADAGDPDLPKISAQELVEKIAASDTEQLSGTVKISTDLGLPDFGGLAGSMGGGQGADGEGGSAADPKSKLMELASGTHTLRVAADGPERQKLSVLDDAAEYSVIRNGEDVWAYDSASDSAFHARGEKPSAEQKKPALPDGAPATPAEFAEQVLKASEKNTSVSVDGTMRVAGRDAYKLLVEPKGESAKSSTVGAVTIAVDAETGTPLKFTLTPAGGGAAVVDAGFTKVDFARPAASNFEFAPPKGTKVTEAEEIDGADGPRAGYQETDLAPGKVPAHEPNIIGEGWDAVAVIEAPGGKGLPKSGKGAGSEELPPEAGRLLDGLTDEAKGEFGTGRVFSTRLVNALVTDDGKVYVGAVTKAALIDAANSAK